jgi:hypothetical protein
MGKAKLPMAADIGLMSLIFVLIAFESGFNLVGRGFVTHGQIEA